MQVDKRYEYSFTSPEETGFPIVSCHDDWSGITTRTMVASNNMSYPVFLAYVGAKFSRSRDGMVNLASEVYKLYSEGVLTPEKRLKSIVEGLKHQSPAGMAHIAVAIEGVPIITAASLFRRTVLHDGQEASTRFIDFASQNDLPKLETLLPPNVVVTKEMRQAYTQLQDMSLGMYLGWKDTVYSAYKKHFNIDTSNKDQRSALEARTYDTIRGFLLSGFKTSMVYVANATTIQQAISSFGAGRVPSEAHLAQSLTHLLKPTGPVGDYVPEIRSLLNHTDPNRSTRDEQRKLRDYLLKQDGFASLLSRRRVFEGLVKQKVELIKDSSDTDKIVAQHIVNMYPSLVIKDALAYVKRLTAKQFEQIGEIIFADRNRFNMPSIAAAVGGVAVDLGIDLGIERDLGRHRALERNSPIHETFVGHGEVANTGFTQIGYLEEIAEMAGIQKGMAKDMIKFYEARQKFLDRLGIIAGREAADVVGMYLLPLAHQVNMVMHGDPQKLVHFWDTRIREGAHIDARRATASMNQQVCDSHPLFRVLRYADDRVQVNSRVQFIDRS